MIFADIRGELHSLKCLPFAPQEVLVSVNERHVLRGLHLSPYAKFIYVSEGHIHDFYFDVAKGQCTKVDMPKGSMLYIPANCAHGFYCFQKSTVIYFLEERFDASRDRNISWMSPDVGLGLSFDQIVISEKDKDASYLKKYKYLVLGGSGYLGSNLIKHLGDGTDAYLQVDTRVNDIEMIRQHIIKSGCEYVLCAAGISGRPTIEWCEDNVRETFEVNYLDMLRLMRVCDECGVHLTIFGSGLVFTGEGKGKGKAIYTENDVPDLVSKVYTRYRVDLENKVRSGIYPRVLYLRILYPCTFDGAPKCFFTKMKDRCLNGAVHDVQVPLTVVPDLFPRLRLILDRGAVGVLNFVNEGTVSLPHLLQLGGVECKNTVHAAGAVGNGYGLSVDKLNSFMDNNVSNVQDAVKQFAIKN